INPGRINRPDACACNCRNRKTPVFAIRREQLNGITYAYVKQLLCKTRPENDRARVVSKIREIPVDQLLQNVGALPLQGRIDSVNVDGAVWKSGARRHRAAEHRSTGNDI